MKFIRENWFKNVIGFETVNLIGPIFGREDGHNLKLLLSFVTIKFINIY